MPKSSLSYKTTKRPKEPFDPALDDPIALTPDQLETVVGGLASLRGVGGTGTIGIGGATLGIIAPPPKPPYIPPPLDRL
jgi:hypothetical protein